MCYNNYIIHIDTANAGGKQSDGRCITLYMSCEDEQKTLNAAVPKMQAYPETETDKTVNLQEFVYPFEMKVQEKTIRGIKFGGTPNRRSLKSYKRQEIRYEKNEKDS